MIKKLLLTSVAFLSLANVAFGQITTDYLNVRYRVVDDEWINDGNHGTKEENFIISVDAPEQAKFTDKYNRNLEIAEKLNTTYYGVTEYATMTPLQIVSGTKLELADYSESEKIGAVLSKATVNMIVSMWDYMNEDASAVVNNDEYKFYVKICTYIKKGFYSKTTSGRGASMKTIVKDILTGKEIKAIDSSKTCDDNDESYDLVDGQYYRTQRTNDKFDYVYAIDDVTLQFTESITYQGYSKYYQTKNLPKGIIKNTTASLIIPASLQTIEAGAFANADRLNSINADDSEIYDVMDGILYQFDPSKNQYTMLFVTPNVNNTEITLDNNVVAIKDDPFIKTSNVTVYSQKLPSKDYSNNCKVVNIAGGPVTTAMTKTTDFATINYYNVAGSIKQSDMTQIIKDTWGANYVDLTGATVTGDIDIDAAITAAGKTNNLNTIYIFATANKVTGKNAVNNGVCANFVLQEDDNTFFSPIDFKAEKATVLGYGSKSSRSVGANWSTLCWPFAVDDAAFSAKFKFGVLTSYRSAGNIFDFETRDYIQAYAPNVVKARSNSSTSFGTLTNVQVKATPSTEVAQEGGDGGYFVGVLKTKKLVSDKATAYYVWSSNKISRVNGGEVGTYRCYMTAPNQLATASATMRIIDFDGNEIETFELETEETGIEAISDKDNNSTIYNISGQKVENAKSGMYVVNGKKEIIK